MRANRRTLFLGYPPPSKWSLVPEEVIPPDRLQLFQARVQAVCSYYDGLPVRDIKSVTGLSVNEPLRLTKRCLTLRDDGAIRGFAAIIPDLHIKPYVRSAPVRPKREHQRGGMAGALTRLLTTYPDIEQLLVPLIRKEATELGVPEMRLRLVTLHRIFKKCLREKLKIPGTEWPFTCQYEGKRSIAEYMRYVLNSNFARTVKTREEQPAKAHLAVGTGVPSLLHFGEIYQAVEIDAYDINALFTVYFKSPKGFKTPVPLSRIWLLAVVERKSTVVLAFSIVYKTEVGADDVLRLIRQALDPNPTLPELTIPGACYPSDGGFPCQIYPQLASAVWTVTMLDRALSNEAKSVRERARRRLGFVINWGPARHFERRPNVERLFRTIDAEVFGRLPSTTGSHPHKRRAPNAAQKALRLAIEAEHAEQTTAVHVLQHNVTPSEGLGSISPLHALGQALEQDGGHFLPRYVPVSLSSGGNLLTVREIRTVRGGIPEGRHPYVTIDRVRYTSPALVAASGLIGEEVMVEIDEEDMRQVELYLMDGTYMGPLTAAGQWSRTKHDRKTRKAINSALVSRELILGDLDDPVLCWLRMLSTPKKNVRRLKPKELPTPRDATEAVRVARAAGSELYLGQSVPAALNAADKASKKPALTPKMRSTPSVMAKPAPDVRGLINRGKPKD